MANDASSKAEHREKWELVMLIQKNNMLPSMEELDMMDVTCAVAPVAQPQAGGSSGSSSARAEPPAKRKRASK